MNDRDQIAQALPCPVCGARPGTPCLRAREDNTQPHMTRVKAADALVAEHEREVREKVAQEIEAEYRRPDGGLARGPLLRAAKIARGGA